MELEEIRSGEVKIMRRTLVGYGKCSFKISKRSCGRYEVVLSKTSEENYRGISTTNAFEHFATVIRHEHLCGARDKIIWYDLMDFGSEAFEALKVRVDLAWNEDTKRYEDPVFKGVEWKEA